METFIISRAGGGIQRNVYLSISGKMYYVQENGIVARGIVRTMNGHGDLCAFDDTTGAQITQKRLAEKKAHHIIG